MEEKPRFKIICDESNNSEEDRKNGVIHVDIYIRKDVPIDSIPIDVEVSEKDD